MSVQRTLLLGAIEIINKQIEILKDAGIEIHDADNFDWVIDYIRYSDASDSVTMYSRAAEVEDEEDYEDRKEWHEGEMKSAS